MSTEAKPSVQAFGRKVCYVFTKNNFVIVFV